MRPVRPAVLSLFAFAGGLTAGGFLIAADRAEVDYTRDIRPLLANACYQCHGPDDAAREAGLRLDRFDGAAGELPSGERAIVPGDAGASGLLARITASDPDVVMPPPHSGKSLSPREVELLRRWIDSGAPYAVHWSFVPPARPVRPEVSHPGWGVNPIDDFVLARLDREGLQPAPEADRHTLLRRVSIDLTGLPPTPEEVALFVNDRSPDAYGQAVDRLLAKSAYGERWAALWLDLARYGDSAGYIHDPLRSIWRWRDWLIEALNRNLPYDEFSRDMLAGDLLPDATTEQIIATGFHRNTTTNTEGGSNAAEYHYAAVVDRVNTTFEVWMGVTMACAQCHNHKYDPFTQRDYYQIVAIFNSQEDFNSETPARDVPRVGRDAEFADRAARLEAAQQTFDAATAAADAAQPEWESAVDRDALPPEVVEAIAVAVEERTPQHLERIRNHHRTTREDWRTADEALKAARAARDEVGTTAMVMREVDPRPTHVFIRGDFRSPAEPVQPGVPAALHAAAAEEAFNRLALARWLFAPENPLTARVAVNRMWQELFGIGLVETAEEFGAQGELPSHPELLDWLATEYVRLGWDTKRLLKTIVMSRTYRQASQGEPEQVAADPYNRLLARGPRVRLSAEQLRDQALAVSGLLSPKLYGPPVHPHQPTNGLAAAFGSSTDWETSRGEDRYRRALYTQWRRNLPYPSMVAFDVPERAVCSTRRIRTNTPVQALVTLNDPVFVEAAQALARRILTGDAESTEARAALALETVLARPATAGETQRIVELCETTRAALGERSAEAELLATRPLGPLPEGVDSVEAAAWTVVANVLLNLDEALMKR
ncbi:MAG: PSD1 domain-containing protein [Planctomyces sp.]|nr:PSD1 domain-containing protein [Planctomyces sp.]